MRGIKFRVWSTFNKKMIEKNSNYYLSLDGDLFQSDCLDYQNKSSFVIMQYIGLKDKNGVEIYESDIIQSRDGERKYIVKWDDKEANYYGEMIGRIDNNFIAWNRFEVIGNVYQNEKLLDKGPKASDSTE